jgi:cyclopropane fatty-acyl-phospholipid synthase-like methyltransferase
MKVRRQSSPALASMEKYYVEGHASWDIGKPQPTIANLVASTRLGNPIVEVGCGTGEHCLLLAAKGYAVTGVDMSPTAILTANKKKSERNLDVTFVQANVLEWSPPRPFKTVLDVGFFHCLADHDVKRYLVGLTELLDIGGRLHLLCIRESPHDSAAWPYAYQRAELERIFASGWKVESIVDATDHNAFGPDGLDALLLNAERTG